MMKTVIISFVLVIFAANVSSQERNIWAEVIGYLQAEEFSGKLERGHVYAYELLTNAELTLDGHDGIYRIGVFASHTFTHFMLLDNGKVTFLNGYSDLTKTLEGLFLFFDDVGTKISCHKKLRYIKEVLYWHESNKNRIPW